MDSLVAMLLGLMRRARFVFVAVYLVVAAGFLVAEPGAGWTWFIIVAGAILCALFWTLVAFWTHVFTGRRGRDGADGNGHG
jgi:hypothetical protein